MSIVSEIERIKTNIANAYAKCEEKGATMPSVLNSANLMSCIASITGGETTQKYLSYYGLATNRSNTSGSLTASNIGNYMLFAGGTGEASSKNVDAYDDALVKTTPSALSQARFWVGSASNSNYVLLAGGNVGSDKCTAVVDTYDNSLVRGTATDLSVARQQIAGATAGGNILFGGGHASSVYATVDTYDANLTKGTTTDLSVGRSNLTATNIGGNALFGGGNDARNTVDAYNSNLVKVSVDSLTEGRYWLASSHTKNYALFAGGEKATSSYSDVVDVYDKNLVKRTPTKLSKARGRVGGADIGGFAVVFDGYAGYNVTTVEMFDDNLTRVQLPDTQYSRAWASGASAGRYLYISGGTYEVDVYELVG